ncbi:DMT family transporter [Desulfocurvus sp. DL9XJH121]
MTDQNKAYYYALATVALWSTVASAFKLSLRVMEPVQLLLYASAASLAVLLAILAARGRLGLLAAMSRGQWLRSAGLGALNPFIYYMILFKAYNLLPAQEAQPLNYTWAVTLALFSVPLLGQRLGLRELAALLVSYSGVVVISTHGDPLSMRFSDPLGVALALASTVIWALYWIAGTRDDRDPVAGLAANFLFGTAYVALAALLVSDPVVTDWRALSGAAYVGVFEMGLTFVLWQQALRLSETTARVGNLIFLSPFLSLVLIHYLVGEDILASTFWGLALIVGGIVLQQTRHTAS